VLSGDIFQPARNKGDLAFEVANCIAKAASDSPDCWLAGGLFKDRLIYSYQMSSEVVYFSVYDFSRGLDSQGLEALADPSTRQPYAWSPPQYLVFPAFTYGPRAMGAVKASDGLRFYAGINDNGGIVAGRVDQLFTGSTDNGSFIVGSLYSKLVVAPKLARFSVMKATVQHKVAYNGVTMGWVGSTTPSLTSSGSAVYKRQPFQADQAGRGPLESFQVVFADATSSVGGLLWEAQIDAELLPKVGV
jgi:hypothetical protein